MGADAPMGFHRIQFGKILFIKLLVLLIVSGMLCICICCSLPSTNEVCKGYVFTRVCLSTGGEYQGRYTPGQVHLPGR